MKAESVHPSFVIPHPHYHSETELRAAVVRALREQGIRVRAEVSCADGTADIVTNACDAVIEVKWRLTRAALFAAVGQVLVYRQRIAPAARAIVVG